MERHPAHPAPPAPAGSGHPEGGAGEECVGLAVAAAGPGLLPAGDHPQARGDDTEHMISSF